MRRRTILIIATAVVVIAAGVGFAIWRNDNPSYGTIAKNCTHALKARPDGDKTKPKDCEGLSEDDYQTLLMSHVLKDDLGWVDEDGNVDQQKMLDDATQP
ncbi:hypothetical protein [Streptomyces sp. NPDC005302]|uniref:hypothetical protein n=1 Tax=Streptomyces sp. NPDC005302 TaxID=3154675 RepID=UPI0033B086DB